MAYVRLPMPKIAQPVIRLTRLPETAVIGDMERRQYGAGLGVTCLGPLSRVRGGT